MANQHKTTTTQPVIELVPLVAVILILAHVLGLVYWIYKLATQKQPEKRKEH
ncbi:hypothetical protein LguiA_002732 [Lonicera macranthoides]